MNNNKTALITGASSGIGLQLAHLFAKDKYNLVIVSRDEQLLNDVAIDLKNSGAPRVEVIAADLSTPEGPEKVISNTQQMGIEVDILVNDAGVGIHGKFIETDLEAELKIIQLNIASLVHLTKAFLPRMVERRSGKILQLASIASYQPTPLLAVYAATKAFVLSFTDAITNEIQDTGVTITSLIPGPTDTDFFRKAHAENTKAAHDNPEDPYVVAQVGYEALMKGEHHATAPGVKSQILMSTLMPNERVAAKAKKTMEPDEDEQEAAE
jgi:short-subunit dehydrogenase